MKFLAKFTIAAVLAATSLCAKDDIKIHFDKMHSHNRFIPAINLTYKQEEKSKIAIILSYANNILDFEHTLAKSIKITDTRLVLSYKF